MFFLVDDMGIGDFLTIDSPVNHVSEFAADITENHAAWNDHQTCQSLSGVPMQILSLDIPFVLVKCVIENPSLRYSYTASHEPATKRQVFSLDTRRFNFRRLTEEYSRAYQVGMQQKERTLTLAVALGDRIAMHLERAGIRSIDHLALYRRRNWLDIDGIGAASADRIENVLGALGYDV